ncbi:peptidase associated/transthyretin-like domain-containing protein [Capnocytophaga canimorsus]|uniref:hypothetical protein n=1 Tax=Capnocytophaga canimorsus TaxID=28188 RepID=UPI00385BF939
MNNMSKSVSYTKNFEFKENVLGYDLHLKKKRNWWWLLLLLLPFSLLIQCEKTINVKVVVAGTGEPVSDFDVQMDYTSRYLYKDKKVFYSKDYSLVKTTDKEGIAKFDSLGYSVYSSIFFALSQAKFMSLDPDCGFDPKVITKNFHYTKNVTIEIPLADIVVKVVDAETLSPIPEAEISSQIAKENKQSGKGKTNANGEFTIKGVLSCGGIDEVVATAHGYEKGSVSIDVKQAKHSPELRTIKLKPIKERIEFFVKNKFTKEPVPNAQAVITLVDKASNTKRVETTTNVDGLGVGIYDDAFILSKLKIKASKQYYKDGELEDDYTVEEFVKLSEELRTVYLEPEPNVVDFRNLDSLTRRPIAGVTNRIVVKSVDGNTYTYEEISNTNGVFSIKAIEGDEITIMSKYDHYYKPKETHIPSFKSPEDILMEAKVHSLKFRTVEENDASNLVDNCALKIFVDGKLIPKPNNSGTGVFVVDNLYENSKISIVASKFGYVTNDYTIKEVLIEDLLKTSKNHYDIPMKSKEELCTDEVIKTLGHEIQATTHNLGKSGPSRFVFLYYCDNYPDRIIIYNCKKEDISKTKPIFDTGYVSTDVEQTVTIPYTSPIITIQVTPKNGNKNSYWSYKIICP